MVDLPRGDPSAKHAADLGGELSDQGAGGGGVAPHTVLLLGEIDGYAVIDLRSTIRTLRLASDFRAAPFVEMQSALQSKQALQVPVSVPAEPASLTALWVFCVRVLSANVRFARRQIT